MKIKTKICFGDVVKDEITGFEGTVTGFSAYITGCYQFLVSSKCVDNKENTRSWFDEGRLTVLKKKQIKKKSVSGKTNGCDMMAPIK